MRDSWLDWSAVNRKRRPVGRRGGDRMAGYRLEGPKPARMYEVILPKKLGYFGKVQEVSWRTSSARTRSAPSRSSSGRSPRAGGGTREFDEEAWVKTLCPATRGYSIYEMDGRYLTPTGPVDERVLVIRFIFHNPETPPGTHAPEYRLPGRVAGGRQPPGRPPVRRGAGRRGGDLVPGIQQPPARHLAEGCRRRRRPTDEDALRIMSRLPRGRTLRRRRAPCWLTPPRGSPPSTPMRPSGPRRLEPRP